MARNCSNSDSDPSEDQAPCSPEGDSLVDDLEDGNDVDADGAYCDDLDDRADDGVHSKRPYSLFGGWQHQNDYHENGGDGSLSIDYFPRDSKMPRFSEPEDADVTVDEIDGFAIHDFGS